jgi:transposase
VFVAEIGDITRFSRAQQLACWAGLTPKHHESDSTIHRGRITKQGSRLVGRAVGRDSSRRVSAAIRARSAQVVRSRGVWRRRTAS